uniref:Uncharacterized protein n=1 Tax=Rhizophagus irregularis (strain DAOM 181602 / DAOM 197198 / MUCL 43194) TaxID=747089 RepID=U9TL56_RHIID
MLAKILKLKFVKDMILNQGKKKEFYGQRMKIDAVQVTDNLFLKGTTKYLIKNLINQFEIQPQNGKDKKIQKREKLELLFIQVYNKIIKTGDFMGKEAETAVLSHDLRFTS